MRIIAVSILGAAVLAGFAGCGGSDTPGATPDFNTASGGAVNVNGNKPAGGTSNAATGGNANASGGTSNPAAGGAANAATGGSSANAATGGAADPGTGGAADPGTGGAANPGTGGAANAASCPATEPPAMTACVPADIGVLPTPCTYGANTCFCNGSTYSCFPSMIRNDCPQQQPANAAACTGTDVCNYRQSGTTCTCTANAFVCAPTPVDPNCPATAPANMAVCAVENTSCSYARVAGSGGAPGAAGAPSTGGDNLRCSCRELEWRCR